ncbi:MAG TPA: recombinase family protein [Acidobacteriota bacterium]|nr:recombinase family protein [Acidobacteriota bacterium]
MTCLNSSTAPVPALLPAAQSTRAALYQRSTEKSRREETLEVLRRFARLRGWKIQGEYCDQKASRERPALGSLLEKATEGRFELVLIQALEDFGPSLGRAILTLEKLERAGIALVSLEEELDTTPGCEEVLPGLIRALAIFARRRSYRLRRGIRRGVRRMQEEGKPVGRPFKEVDVDKVRRLSRERKLSYRAIARIMGISASKVCEMLKEDDEND